MNEGHIGTTLLQRAKAILLQPRQEWPIIEGEAASIASIYKSYIIPLAAIGPVAGFIHAVLFGNSFFGITHRPSFLSALSTAVVSYIFTLIGVFLMALVIDFLAPRFGGTANRTNAFKLAAYSATAAWVAGAFQLVPGLGMLTVLGLYGLYLLYVGIPVMMKAPEDKAVIYTVAIVVIGAIAGMIFSVILAPLMLLTSSVPDTSDGSLSGSVNVPGVGSLDLSELEKAGEKMAAANERAQSGQATTLPSKQLAAMLPASLPGGLEQTRSRSSGTSVAGVGASSASASYGDDEKSIELTITDLGIAGSLATLGNAMNMESESQNGTVIEKMGKIDGRLTTIRYDSASRDGRYGVIVGDRFNVQVDGDADSVADLRAVLDEIDLAALESIARSGE
ncbi:Yip1 family protein [Parasphingorhabdus flavimaris]|uniref:YIP1 family protein n=1 Tax=Parasphingorhabdus flavimaris TaxID=266812 RepID=A0ABX2N5F4_9SPHN|nr:Yip1 family protein [Parasphingorhabdus flavimaris]NVD28766.1 YIP1 family protein [Parasphingorhabdus flavimaris]|tara:strand:+ start:32256 stop:33434 length:1179 start_codon:yes stop_codon:yes gene_type:complete